MFQTGRIAARPGGMNAGNNMAFLQQARAGRGGGFNPFAPATASRPSMPQGFGAGMYATPMQRSPMPFGGQFGQQDIGALLQQFSQPYGGAMPFGARMSGLRAQAPQNMAVAQPMSPEQGRIAYEQQQQRIFNPSAADQQRSQMARQHASQGAGFTSSSRHAQLMAQEAAMRQAVSASPASGGMTLGGGPRNFGMTPSPQGMNAGNNMAFLQQARASRPQGFNPFAR